jgi:hypothetical protein
MTTPTSTGKTDTFKHPKAGFERLTASKYPSWQNNMQRLLRSIHCWNITSGLEEQPEESSKAQSPLLLRIKTSKI